MTSQTLDLTFERIIAARPADVFDGWLDPRCPGTPWHIAEKLLLTPQVDGFFYWKSKTNSHYGRFIEVSRPTLVQYTWVSKSTLGEETWVTVRFQEHGEGTVMTLAHTGIPDTEAGRGHERGWNFFLQQFPGQFANGTRK